MVCTFREFIHGLAINTEIILKTTGCGELSKDYTLYIFYLFLKILFFTFFFERASERVTVHEQGRGRERDRGTEDLERALH